MVGWSRKLLSDDEFGDPNRKRRESPHFISPSGKKQLAIHQVFSNHKEFNEVLRDYSIKKGFEYYRIKNSP